LDEGIDAFKRPLEKRLSGVEFEHPADEGKVDHIGPERPPVNWSKGIGVVRDFERPDGGA
jgi:hypothetical protein